MADNVEILGISGQIDISQIQQSLDKLCDSLSKVGADTDALSQRMTNALNEITQSNGDLSAKTQQAMDVLRQAMDEAKAGMADVPAMIQTAQANVDKYTQSIQALNEKLSQTASGTTEYTEISKQIDSQRQAVEYAKADVEDLTKSYAQCKEEVASISMAYEALTATATASSGANAAQSSSNVGVSVAAGAATAATAAESAAHTANASAALQNASAENANAEATRNLTNSLQEYISTAAGRADIERMQGESAKDLRSEMKMYEEAIKEIQTTLANTDFTTKIADASAQIEKQQAKIEQYKTALANLTPEQDATGQGTNYYNNLIEQAQERIAGLQEQIQSWQQEHERLNADLTQYNALLEAGKSISSGQAVVGGDTSSTEAQVQSLTELKARLADTKEQLRQLQAEAAKFDGKAYLTDKEKEKLTELNAEIAKTKQELQTLRDAIREKNDDTFIGKFRNQLSDLGSKIEETGSSIKEKIEAPYKSLTDKVSNSGFGQRFSAEFEQVKAGMSDFKSGVVNVMTANGKLQMQMQNLTAALGGMGIPLDGALTGVKAVTKALWAMCSTPIGIVIATIALGLKAVHTWMTKSANGQKVYTKLMAYFGSLAASVTDIVVILGEWLYRAFVNANKPLNDFGKNLVTTFKTAVSTVKNLLEGLYNTVKGTLTRNWKLAGEGLGQLKNAVKDAGKTIASAFNTAVAGAAATGKILYNAFTDDKVGGDLSRVIKGFLSNASKAAEIAGKQQEANIAIGKATKTEAELDGVIAKKREEIYKLTGKAKDEAIEETKALLKQKFEPRIEAQKKLLALQREKNKLHTVSLQDIATERKLNIDLLRTQAQQAASTRMLTRMQEANRRKMAAAEKSQAKQAASQAKREFNQQQQVTAAESKYDDVSYTNIEAREKAIADMESKLADARVAAMREGFEKTQEERKRQQEKEFAKLQDEENAAIKAERKRQKDEFDALQAIRKARGQKVEKWDNDKDFEENDVVRAIHDNYDTLRRLISQKQLEDERKSAEELVKSHQSYIDKRLAIDKQYQRDIAAIDAAIKEARERHDNEAVAALYRSRNQATVDYGKQKMQLAFTELKNSPDYVAAFTDIDKTSTEVLDNLLARFEEVKESAASSLDPSDAKTYFDTINSLLDELISRDPVGMAARLTEQLEKQKKEYADALSLLDKVQNNQYIIKEVRIDKTSGMAKLVPVYYSLADAQQKVATTRQAVAHTESVIEKANKKAVAEVQKLISAFNQLGNVIGGEAGQIIGLIGDVANFVVSSSNAMLSVSTTASKAIQNLEKASAILTIIAGAISIMSKVSSLFKTSDDYYNQYAQKYKEINKLRETVDDYRTAVIKARQEEKNWFSTTGLQSLQDAWETHAQAEQNYYNTLFEAQEQYKNKSSGLSKMAIPVATTIAAVAAGAVTGGLGSAVVGALGSTLGSALAATVVGATVDAIAGYAVGSAAKSAMDKISYKKGQTAAVDNLRIQTQHKSFWRGQKTEDLRDWVRKNMKDDYGNPAELFDAQGLINLEMAKAVVEKYGDKLQGETKETLERLIKLREQYDEYIEELHDYVSQTYSPLVDDMTDAIWSWLAEGKDALAEFKKSASSTFESIGKEMLKQMLLAQVFDGFQDNLTELYKKYSTGGMDEIQLAESMGALMDGIVGKFNEKLPMMEEFLKNYDKLFAERGFDVTGNQQQSATAKGVTSITYDQANLLVNLATARNIALEKGNEVRKRILDALNNKGLISDYPTQESTPIIGNGIAGFSDTEGLLQNMQTALGNFLIRQMLEEGSGGSTGYGISTLLDLQQSISLDTTALRMATAQMQADISVMRDIQEQGLTQLNRIEANTRPISEILSVVNDIYRWQRENS